MKRRIRYMALLLVLCMLALTGCAQPRDTMTPVSYTHLTLPTNREV